MPTDKELKHLRKMELMKEIESSDEACLRYTGVPTVKLLQEIFHWLKPAASRMKLWDGKAATSSGRRRKALSLYEEYALTLIRIRRGYDTSHMAYLFSVSQSHVCRIFLAWANFLAKAFEPLLIWPSRELVRQNLPSDFKVYPKTRVIIDATEFHIERPFRPNAQKLTYSNYKSGNTFKLLVGIMPTGAITFLSKLYNGAISDLHITKCSGLMDQLEEGDDVMADRGFNIRNMLLKKKCTLNIPSFTHGKSLSEKGVKRSRKIARLRIHVERSIRRMKSYKILSGIIPLKLRYCLNKIMIIVSVLCNLQKRLA
jgi:hypothetical protein